MNVRPGSTASISVVVAVVLWSFASWMEGEWKEPDTQPMDVAHAFSDDVTLDTEIRSDSGIQSCREAENSIVSIVNASQYCASDDDCTIFDFGYPIQCLTSIAKNEITALRLEYRKYQRSCEFRVYYDCPSEPLHRQPVCRNNRCTVELQTMDLLKDATLEHIGVDPDARLAPLKGKPPP